MYSFPSDHKGATQDEIKRAAFTSATTHSEIGDTLGTLRRSLFFLELTDDNMFRFTPTENINKIIDRAIRNVSDADANKLECQLLEQSAGTKFYKVHIWPNSNQKIDDIPKLQLIVMKNHDEEFCKRMVTEVSPKNGRLNQNALVFVMPADGGALAESIRKKLAVQDIRRRMSTELSKSPASRRVVDDTYRMAEGGIERGLHEKYTEIWLPDKDNVASPYRTDGDHPSNDKQALGDRIWNKLTAKYQIAEKLDPSVLANYDGSHEEVFTRMMRTCGERRPASPDVVKLAMNKQEQETISDNVSDDTSYPPGVNRVLARQKTEDRNLQLSEEPPVAGLHLTDRMDRKKLAEWGGSMFHTIQDIPTSIVKLVINQEGSDEFSIQLDITGQIPRKVADGVRESVSDGGEYREDEIW